MPHLREFERAGPAKWNFFLSFYPTAVEFHLVLLWLTILHGWDLMVALPPSSVLLSSLAVYGVLYAHFNSSCTNTCTYVILKTE